MIASENGIAIRKVIQPTTIRSPSEYLVGKPTCGSTAAIGNKHAVRAIQLQPLRGRSLSSEHPLEDRVHLPEVVIEVEQAFELLGAEMR